MGLIHVNKAVRSFCCKPFEGFSAKVFLRLANTVTAGPIGLYTAGLVGPKTTNVLTPIPAAKCVIPLSLPTNPSAQLKSPITCVKDKSVKHLATFFMPLILVWENLCSSAGPNKNTTSVPLERACSAIDKKLFKSYFFEIIRNKYEWFRFILYHIFLYSTKKLDYSQI